MCRQERLAVVMMHPTDLRQPLEFPWLEKDLAVDSVDWLLFSRDEWEALAAGDEVLWGALERKLLIGFYLSQPGLIAVVGRTPEGAEINSSPGVAEEEVARIVRRIQSLLLPSRVVGFCADGNGTVQEIVESDGWAVADGMDIERLAMAGHV